MVFVFAGLEKNACAQESYTPNRPIGTMNFVRCQLRHCSLYLKKGLISGLCLLLAFYADLAEKPSSFIMMVG